MMEMTSNILKVSQMDRLINYFLLLRISHWSKSIFVMLGFFYTSVSGYLTPAFLAALAFCLISSSVYIYNDIQDRTEDSLHPHKCYRPLASEQVTVSAAIGMLFFLLISGLGLGWFVSKHLALILMIYLVVNLAYNHVLKLIPVLDVASIAAGFMLRVLAGTVGIGIELSGWLLIASTLLSLFIALNKRQLELQLGLKNATRKVLKRYKPVYLHWFIIGSGVASYCMYLLYIIFARDEAFFFVLTLPFAAIALWRFGWLATQEVTNDDPVTVFLSDRLSRINFYCFIILTFLALTR